MRTLDLYVRSALAAMICLIMLIAAPAYARVEGQCADCHTMHNSQNGLDLAGLPGDNLTKGDCVGCHTGTNTGSNSIPYVLSTSDPYSTHLAGGNFYWVLEVADNRGHNVKGIPGMTVDEALLATGAPGGQIMCSQNSCHSTLFTPEMGFGTDVTPLNTGCEGCHLEVKHHAPQQAEGTPATEENGFFRFLRGHSGGEGVHGIEDPKWEFMADCYNHNEYLGDTDKYGNSHTMTRYCTGCHGDFHNQKDTDGAWVKHPSDGLLSASPECSLYFEYDPTVPVARPNLDTIAETSLVADGDMVMCLSCHRAHGSPYPDALRWNYANMKVGDGGDWKGTGCFKCHTDKD